MNTILSEVFSDHLLDGEGPKYKRLSQGLIDAISSQRLEVGVKLPPVRDLAWTLKITPGTVARAYSILSEQRWVSSEVGRGTFVCDRPRREASPPPAVPAPVIGRDTAFHAYPETDFLFAPRLPEIGQVKILREALMAAAALPEQNLLRYPHFGAQRYAREAIHAHIPEDERQSIDPDSIIMTNGGQNAIMLSLQTLLIEGPRVVMVEQYSYPGLRRAVELLGATVVAVPMDDEGVLPDELDRIAKQTGAKLFFTMPEAHNPTCAVTSDSRRMQTVEVARRHGFHLVQDDCYRLGEARGPSYRKLLPHQSWFISSFSKTISPALRAGYVVTPEGWASKLRRVVDVNFFGVSAPAAETMHYVLSHPELSKIVTAMRERNRAYIEIALNVLGRFDLGWSHDVPFFWLRLTKGWRVPAFCQLADSKGIRVRPGDDFALRDGPTPQAVRISVNGQMELDRFRDVLEELATMMDNPPEEFNA